MKEGVTRLMVFIAAVGMALIAVFIVDFILFNSFALGRKFKRWRDRRKWAKYHNESMPKARVVRR